jgi:hypothetical protein
MTVAAPPRSSFAKFAPVVAALILAVLVAAVVLLVRAGREPQPPRPGAFAVPAPGRATVALDVQQLRGAALTLGGAGGNIEATPRQGVAVFSLQPARAGDAAPGDWIVVAGISNEVLNFTIHSVTIIPAALGAQPDAEGFPRLPSGFAGYETNRDARDRPMVAGRVTAVQGQSVTFTGPSGPVTLDGGQTALIRRMAQIGADAIRPGDRIVYLPSATVTRLEDAPALLLLPAGG